MGHTRRKVLGWQAYRGRASQQTVGICVALLLASLLLFARKRVDSTAEAPQRTQRPGYTVTPLPLLGAEVRGIDLKQDVAEETVQAIREDVTRHRLLVFKDQDSLPPERQVAITKWFGPLEVPFKKHAASPHPLVLRLSNDKAQGLTKFGAHGWHVDGFFAAAPNSNAIYHIWELPRKQAPTDFIGLNELIQAVPAEQRARWERLWLDHAFVNVTRPLIYPHPLTGIDTMCFHTGNVKQFTWDYGTQQQRKTFNMETKQLAAEIEDTINSGQCCSHLVYSHQWQRGDLIISDNLAVAHQASPETQLPAEEAGLRVLHRTATQGTYVPVKQAGTTAAG